MAMPENPGCGQEAQHRATDRRLQRDFSTEGPRTPEEVPQTRPEPAPRRHFTSRKLMWETSGSGAIYRILRELFVSVLEFSILIGRKLETLQYWQ